MNAQFEYAQHKLLSHALSCLLRFGERLSITFQAANGQKDSVVRFITKIVLDDELISIHVHSVRLSGPHLYDFSQRVSILCLSFDRYLLPVISSGP